jgi:hypothetical protein
VRWLVGHGEAILIVAAWVVVGSLCMYALANALQGNL